jgi:hypothetical protein
VEALAKARAFSSLGVTTQLVVVGGRIYPEGSYMDVDKFLKASLDLYYSAPGFFNYSVPILVGGYIAFLWSGYGIGKWVQQGEISGLKAASEAGKAQNDALKSTNDVLKEKVGVLDERVKLAKEQADKAKQEAEEFKAEADELRRKLEANSSRDELKRAFMHLDVKAANVLAANNAVSSTLTPPRVWYGGGDAIEIKKPSNE